MPPKSAPVEDPVYVVLSGGGARGAYEAGVMRYVIGTLRPRLEARGVPFRIAGYCGTSAGAINACYLGSTAHDPVRQADELSTLWSGLTLEQTLRLGWREAQRLPRLIWPRHSDDDEGPSRPSRPRGVFDTSGIQAHVRRSIDWRALRTNIDQGAVDAVAIAATEIATGRTRVFVHSRDGKAPRMGPEHLTVCVPTRLAPKHALASAAIPAVFPPVRVGGRLHADGGLRQNTPLSPAIRLGAGRVLIVSLQYQPDPAMTNEDAARSEAAYPTLGFLAGKALTALTLEAVDRDLENLRMINLLMHAGEGAMGPAFMDAVNAELIPAIGRPLRRVEWALIRPSEDPARLAWEHMQSEDYRKRADTGAKLLTRLFDSASEGGEAELASYLLFDGGYTQALIELGERDAAARADELEALFAGETAAPGGDFV